MESGRRPASVKRLPCSSFNLHPLLINGWSQQIPQNIQSFSFAKKERHIHADNTTTEQPPSQPSPLRTQPQSYRGPQRDKAVNYKIPPNQHEDVGLIFPAQEPRRLRTLLEGGEIWALSYTWSLPPSPSLNHYWDTSALSTRPKLASTAHHCLHQMETDTMEDTASNRG